MTTFEREEILKDKMLKKLLDILVEKHKPARHTLKFLKENAQIENLCQSSRNFVSLGDDLFVHYDLITWLKKGRLQARIDRIGVYDDHLEYDIARLKGLHSGRPADIPNIN